MIMEMIRVIMLNKGYIHRLKCTTTSFANMSKPKCLLINSGGINCISMHHVVNWIFIKIIIATTQELC